jgi:hypothetical protein
MMSSCDQIRSSFDVPNYVSTADDSTSPLCMLAAAQPFGWLQLGQSVEQL